MLRPVVASARVNIAEQLHDQAVVVFYLLPDTGLLGLERYVAVSGLLDSSDAAVPDYYPVRA